MDRTVADSRPLATDVVGGLKRQEQKQREGLSLWRIWF